MDNKAIFAKNLRHFMERDNKSRQQICDDLDFNYFTFTDWVNGKKFPRIDKIEKLADYFGVKKSALIETHDFDNVNVKTNSFIADTVLQMQNDSAYLEAVISLSKLNKEKLEIAKRLLDALDKQA